MNTKSLLRLAVFAAAAGTLASCSQDINPYDALEEILQQKTFAFQTTHDVNLNIDYGTRASRAYVELYDEDPLKDATVDDFTAKGSPIYSAHLNEQGKFAGKINIPTHVEHVYAYSPSWSTPLLLEADVKNGAISVVDDGAVNIPGFASRATRNYSMRPLSDAEKTGNGTNFYTLNGGWDVYGKTNNENDLITMGSLTPQDIASIQTTLWHGQSSKPGGLNNSKYIVNNVNVFITDSYIDEDGQKQDVESAEVWFTFVTEAAWNENTVGYYTYKHGTTPDLNSLKKYVILPNASIANQPPFGLATGKHLFDNASAPAFTNIRIQLLYEDEQGNVTPNFPVGTDIGFFVLANGFTNGSTNGPTVNDAGRVTSRTEGRIGTNSIIYYTNKEFNDDKNAHYIALALNDGPNRGTIVYGVEDGGGDLSYDDILFTLSANPNKAMKPEAIEGGQQLGQIETGVKEVYQTVPTIQASYGFEDIWPDGGDYDLNDVLARHTRYVTFNQFNIVSRVEDVFVFDNKGQASDKNAFAFQIPLEHRGTLTLPEGAIDERETGSIIITDDCRYASGKEFRVVRELTNGLSKTSIDLENLNPFIINQTRGPQHTANNRIEIHLPNERVTVKGIPATTGKSPWFISNDGLHPYAISIPDTNFKPCDPGVRIGSGEGAYPDFNKWVESLGKLFNKWYFNR